MPQAGYQIDESVTAQPPRPVIAENGADRLAVVAERDADNWGPIRSTLGVVSIVRFGYQPARIPDHLVSMLRAREDGVGIQVVPVEEYKRGGKVRITDGSFMGYEGIFLAKTSRERVVVLLDILGKHTRTVVDAATIEPG